MSKWFIRSPSHGVPALRVICFAYAGGSASTFFPWFNLFPGQVEVVAVQLPGRSERFSEAAIADMTAVLDELMLVLPVLFSVPYILFGHSLGSRLAFEFMVRVSAQGLRLPEHFIASGSSAPHQPRRKPPIADLPDDEFIEELKTLKGTPQEVLNDKELMMLYMPTLRADFKLAEKNFTADVKIDRPLSVLGGEDDDVTREELQAWGDLFSSPAKLHMLPGDHFFINSHRSLVIDRIKIIVNDWLKNKTSIHNNYAQQLGQTHQHLSDGTQ